MNNSIRARDVRRFTFCSHSDGTMQTIALGPTRLRAALIALMRGGRSGVSFYDDPAPRWASHIHRLRGRGLLIRTCREPHGGSFPGIHAGYHLETDVVELPPATVTSLTALQPVATKTDPTSSGDLQPSSSRLSG